MKRYLFCTCLLFMICILSQGKERTIKCPPFIAWSSNSIEINKIGISDTATVLYIKAFYHPKQWICIASKSFLKDNNGETYPLRSGIGIKPDTEFWMPESGEAEFQLVFPALPKSVTSIDFSEGDNVEGAFKIWGIQLQGNKLPELVLPNVVSHSTKPDESFVMPALSYKSATIKGRILDYRPGMTEELYIDISDPVKGFTEGPRVKVHPNGSFSLTVPVAGITPSSFHLFGKQIHFFLIPGQTSEVIVNTRELCRQQSKLHKSSKSYGQAAFFNGTLSNLARELSENKVKIDLLNDFDALLNDIADMDANAYKEYVLEKRMETQKEIDATSFSEMTKSILSIGNDICAAQAISIAPNIMTQATLKQGKITQENVQKYYSELEEKLPADYLDVLKDFSDINTPNALLSDDFRTAVYMLLNKKDILSNLWNNNQGAFFDAAEASKIYQNIKDFKPLTEADLHKLAILPEAYRTLIEKENHDLLKTIEANKKKNGFRINELGEVSNEDLFASLISPFRNKVILVDFWATWCGPCRMANKAMIPLKKELAGKEIVYLYLTGESSPLETWKNMIPDIHGEHFRVTDAQWSYLTKTFQIEGVPTYFIIDRNGEIKYKETGFPGTEKMKEQLILISGE